MGVTIDEKLYVETFKGQVLKRLERADMMHAATLVAEMPWSMCYVLLKPIPLTDEERAGLRRGMSYLRKRAKPQGEARESVHPSHMWGGGDRCVACTCRKDALYLSTKPCDYIGPDGVQAPSVGRIVHYFGKLKDKVPFTPTREADADLAYDYFHEPDDGPFASLVIDVTARDVCTLEVTGRAGRKYIRANVPFDDKMALGTWCWPVRT